MNITIITAEFHKELNQRMLSKALETARGLDLETKVIRVPGVYDMPLAISKVVQDKKVDAVVLLGVVKKGATDHDKVVAENTARIAADLSVKYGKPITLGVIGPNAPLDIAEPRVEEYAERAVRAAKALLCL